MEVESTLIECILKMSLGIERSTFRLPDTLLVTGIQQQIAANGLETLFFKSLKFSLDF